MTNIEMFTGKGGVGKTTFSVATALRHAEHGKTLLISTDPTGSLSNIFSRRVDQEVCNVATNLDAVELTRKMIFVITSYSIHYTKLYEGYHKIIFTIRNILYLKFATCIRGGSN